VIFTSSTTFIPSSQERSSGSSLSGVASLVGINLGAMSSGNEIPSSMYPQVSESVEFKRLMLEEFIDEKKQIVMKSYLADYYKIDDNLKINNSNKSFISKFEDKLFNLLQKKIFSISVNEKDGFVTISANMPESEYAAYAAINARNILQKIIINTKIKGAKQNLKFSEEQLKSKRIEFDEIQNKLGYFNDSNLNIVTSSIINERKKLEADFQIINAVIVELSKQVEQNKLQVSKDTPVFSIIKEATMPVLRSSPKRAQMVLIFGFLGLILSIVYVLLKDYLLNIINEIRS
jgi:LPS O-antigen subunit length determinant protein (WzzB/FepE family)